MTGAANTLTASSGVALNVSATTIGAAGMTFRSVSSGAGANVGISLDDTGNLAGLTVTGTGSAGSGGTINGKTGADGSLTAGIGIFLRDTRSPSFSWMQLNDFENFAIRGFRVNGLTLSNSVVNSLASGTSRNGNSDVQNEGSVAFGEEPDVPALGSPAINGLTGAVTIANCVIEDGFENNFKISNTSGSLAPFSMTATTIRNTSTASPGNNGLEFRYSGNAGLDATITGSTFTANRSNAIQFSSLQSFTGSANLQVGAESTPGSGSTFSDNNIGVNIANGGTGSVNFGVHRGTFTTAGYAGTIGAGGASSQININMAAPSSPGLAGGPMSGSLTQNNINNANSTTGPGMRIVANGTDGDGSNVVTVRVVNNTISQVANRGIEVLTRDGNATINATIRGNSVQLTDPSAADAIFVVAGATSTAVGTGLPDSGTVNLDAADNDANTSVGFGIRVRQRFSSTYRLEQYAGLAADDAAVVAYLLARNPLSAGFSADHTAAGSAGFLTTASVPEP
ncbi:MAG: hypothetical protein JNL89_10430 [Rhodanobacteraceae bacterium]|nr:hypothetical protein [Rhodanobacteraceae bacterium]